MEHRQDGILKAGMAMATVGGAVTASTFLTGYPLFAAQAVRYALAAGVMALVTWRRQGLAIRRPVGRDWMWLVASASAGLTGYNLAVLRAVEHAEPAAIGTIVAGVPLVLAVVVPLADRRRPPLRLVVAAAVVVIGAVIVHGGGRTDATGVLFALLALAGETGFTLLALPVLKRLGPFSVATHTAWIAAVQLVILAVGIDGRRSLTRPDAAVVLAIAYLVAASAGAFVLWFLAVERIGGELAGLAAGVIPVAAVVTGLVFGRTTIDVSVIGGSVVVALGIAFGLAATSPRATVLAITPLVDRLPTTTGSPGR